MKLVLLGPVSQNFDFVLDFVLCQKTTNFLLLFGNVFSRFHKIKVNTLIKDLRRGSLHVGTVYMYTKFHMF